MIPPDDPRTGTTRQVARYVSPTDTFARSADGHLPEVEHVAELWALEGYLRGLQEHYRADRRLYGRVRDVAVRLQALAQEVQASAGPQPAGSRSPASTGRDAVRADLEAAFERWLADPVEADEVRLADRDRSPQPLEQILGVLAASTRALSDEAAASLGMPAGTTVGRAASELWLAVDDPAGPRCRSYRAAAYYLRGLERIGVGSAELEGSPR